MAKLFIQPNTIKLTSDFSFTVSNGGDYVGSATFECRYTDYLNTAITAKLQDGSKLIDLSQDVPQELWFLKINSYTPDHQKGGITKIRVQFKGFKAPEGSGSGTNDRNTSYSYRGTLAQASILEHPNFIAEVDYQAGRAACAGIWIGSAYWEDNTTEIEVIDKVSGDTIDIITPADTLKWARKIINGRRYYDKPQLEWSINQSNEGGLVTAEIEEFGRKVDEPEGNPPKPTWAAASWWMFSGLDEEKDDDTSSFSRVYTLRHEPLDADIYDYAI